MSPTRLSTSSVSRLSGASARMLDYWARTGLLEPTGRRAAGKGSRRLYTFRDVVAILTICKLRERNCPLQQIRATVRYLQAHYPEATPSDTLSRLTLITDGKEVYMLTNEQQVMNVVTRQCVWGVPLGLLIAEASQKIEALPQEWTDEVKVNGRNYRLLVSQDMKAGEYVVECRQLPGVMQRAETPQKAVSAARAAIASLLKYREPRQKQSRGTGKTAG